MFLYLYCEDPFVGLELGGYDEIFGLYVWCCRGLFLCFSSQNSCSTFMSFYLPTKLSIEVFLRGDNCH